ncbi:MAG: hypothetical protein ABSD42_01935 [Candidatus Bathyarchaeia archaeon]|jgi:hypothetical protein
MSQKNKARHLSNCQMAAESAVIAMADGTSNVPMRKRKEDAKQILYLNRI